MGREACALAPPSSSSNHHTCDRTKINTHKADTGPGLHAGALLSPNHPATFRPRWLQAGWSPAKLAEFVRDVYLTPGRTYPTAASYIYAMEKGADHPYAVETLASLRAPGFNMPPFSRPVPKQYEWDGPENPEHTPELRADIEVMSRLWRNRQAVKRDQPWPTEYPPIPRALLKRLYRLRNRYHSLEDTLQLEGLQRYAEPPAKLVQH
ncbi:hypothetical protein GA0061098_1008105 [Bradyrhizobium shewense]|uniref:Uncharacterized protein n=1 Tax=Bradyrhizobium shewense TaxID=1761772 RepID=A0A1C3WJX1_9BRAD|nr:hypothetical protein GA0061098_1008105 [Bradyrhizobium shewense]